MSGLDDLLGSLTKGGGGGGGMEDLLGGLLGGGSGGGGKSGMNMGAMAVALAPLVTTFLKGGGLSKIMEGAHAAGLSAQANSWVSTGENQPIDGQQAKAVVGDDAVKQLAQDAGVSEDEAADTLAKVVPQVVNGLSPNGQLPSDDDLNQLVSRFEG